IVVSGATSGAEPPVNLRRVFAMQLEILGSSMGTPQEFADLMALCVQRDVRPVIDSVFPFHRAREAFERLHSGDVFGKVVLEHAG
ncbi:MAG: zinc-binding dehydrogenase, partial [Dactylosporangium sp.]|nr:zinc-binding dehydrogenase [Dactylosporangium sp.]